MRCVQYRYQHCVHHLIETPGKYATTHSPNHLSLHYDAIKVDQSIVSGNADSFQTTLEQQVLSDTGYTVNIECKQQSYLLDLIKMNAQQPSTPLNFPDEVLVHGNCIPACLLYLGFPSDAIVRELGKNSVANRKDAKIYHGCSFRSVLVLSTFSVPF